MKIATKPDGSSEPAPATGASTPHRLSRRDFLTVAALGAGATVPGLLSAKEAAAVTPPARPSVGSTGERASTYATLNRESWTSILADNQSQMASPVTVHLPIQPVHCPDFIHVDSALNVCRRRVYPKLSYSEAVSKAAQEHETFLVQFAIGDRPIVPDFHVSRLALTEGKYPLVHATHFSSGLFYEFDYFCRSLDERQNLLWIGVAVTNETTGPRTAHVRAKLNFQIEADIFDLHYEPFYWDATKWLPCDKVQLKEQTLCRDEAPIGKVMPGDWKLEWEAKKVFSNPEGAIPFSERHYRVAPCMRLASVQDVMHLSCPLRPGEQEHFWIAVLTDFEGATAEDRRRLLQADPQEGRAAALQHFQSHFTRDHAQLKFPSENWDKLFTELQLSTLQLLVRFPAEPSLMPTQGGSSERFFVWVWEAQFMLAPMLRLGHFEPVRRSLDFIFGLQDSGHPPEGELTTVAGAIGTTGPKWLNTTGSALVLATDYYHYSRDEGYLREYLPKILKAMGWIVGELRATRKFNPDGSRPHHYGIMPFGCATDGDIGLIVAFTDAFTFAGLEKSVTLLERVRHERAAEFRRELEMYRTDLARAIEGLTRPDGYIERKILRGKEKRIQPGFERICGAINFALTGALDVNSEHFRRFVAHFEGKLMDDFFTGRMVDRNIAYMSIGEFAWHHTYLRLREWKKAFAAMRINLRFGMTQDTFQVQERFAKNNPAFTPWQPNGSGNGRILEMMLNSLYFEHDDLVTLLGGVPFLWLANNTITTLQNLRTTQGSVSLEARMLNRQRCRVTVRASARGVLPRRVQLPDHFIVSEVSPRTLSKEHGVLQLPDDTLELSFVLRENAET